MVLAMALFVAIHLVVCADYMYGNQRGIALQLLLRSCAHAVRWKDPRTRWQPRHAGGSTPGVIHHGLIPCAQSDVQLHLCASERLADTRTDISMHVSVNWSKHVYQEQHR